MKNSIVIRRGVAIALFAGCVLALGMSQTASNPTGTLDVVVYKDLNTNAQQDSGEPGLSGWFVTLKKGSKVIPTPATSPTGTITVTTAPGSYTVNLGLNAGWSGTSLSQKSVSVAGGGTHTVSFGVVAPTGTGSSTTGRLRLQVYNSWNGNTLGAKSGWTITVSGPAPAQPLAVTTTGQWVDQTVPAGTYALTLTLKPGWAATTTTKTVIVAAGAIVNSSFGVTVPYGSLRVGAVNDANGDGVGGLGEALLDGWTITVSGASLPSPIVLVVAANQTPTADLAPGTYTVTMTAKPGWTATGPLVRTAQVTAGMLKELVPFTFKTP